MLNETAPNMLANNTHNKSSRLQLLRQLSPRVLKPEIPSFVYSFSEVKRVGWHVEFEGWSSLSSKKWAGLSTLGGALTGKSLDLWLPWGPGAQISSC